MHFFRATARTASVTLLTVSLAACASKKNSQQKQTAFERPADVATLDEAIKSNHDVWGEAAIKQPGGPSYEFFASLLPQLRYVDAPFRHYPITLSAPASAPKVRFVSNGSQINALARQPN